MAAPGGDGTMDDRSSTKEIGQQQQFNQVVKKGVLAGHAVAFGPMGDGGGPLGFHPSLKN